MSYKQKLKEICDGYGFERLKIGRPDLVCTSCGFKTKVLFTQLNQEIGSDTAEYRRRREKILATALCGTCVIHLYGE